MEIEYLDIITINNDKDNYCALFGKFGNIDIKIDKYKISAYKELLSKHSGFFESALLDNFDINFQEINLLKEKDDYIIKEILSYTHGCSIKFRVENFSTYFSTFNSYIELDLDGRLDL